MARPVIALTTDFGQADSYVGIMKGVLLGICPEAALVDISHEIRPQAVHQAAYVLSTAAPFFPPGTVHLVVVDPGVGGPRRPIAVQTERATYVAPDNGVLSLALGQDPARRAVQLTNPRYRLDPISATFHGRDLFAPAAAHIACGLDLQELGDPLPVPDLVALPAAQPEPQPDGAWLGEILHVDRFGNLVTNYHQDAEPLAEDPEGFSVQVSGQRIARLSRTFADVEPGTLVAYIGSSGYLEVAVREGRAAAQLGAEVGTPVRIEGRS